MNIDNQTVLHIKAGQMPPEELLVKILATKPTAFGFAVQEADGSDMQLIREDASTLDLPNLQEFMEGRKERPTTLYFGSLKEGHDVEDIQPFTITDPEEKTFMSIFIEGTINGHDEPAGHTEQANLVNGIIIPKIVEWCQDFEGDIEKIMAKINGEVFNKDFLSHVGHRAILHILPFVGEPVLLGKNELGGEYDWGWTSRTHGFGEVSQEPVVVKTEKKKGYWGNAAKKVIAAVTPEKPAGPGIHTVGQTIIKTVNTEPPKDVATKGEGPRQSVPDVKGEKDKLPAVFVRPPAWLHKNDDIKQFYCLLGDTKSPPSAWKKRIPVEVKANHALLQCKNFDEFTKWRLENLKASTSTPAPLVTKQERLSGEASPPPLPKEMPVQGPIDPTPLPIIEPKDIEKVLDFVAKHLDGNSREIIPPQEMQKLEAQLPVFSEAVGVKLEEMLNWPVSGLFGLAATDARAMVLWGLQWRAYARPFLMAELKAKSKDGHATTADTVKTTVTKTQGGAVKTESVAKVPTAAPKKNSWGYGKNKAA